MNLNPSDTHEREKKPKAALQTQLWSLGLGEGIS